MGGNIITYPGEVSTPTTDTITAKCIFNRKISTPRARFMCCDIKIIPCYTIGQVWIYENNNYHVPWLNNKIIKFTGNGTQWKYVMWYTAWYVWADIDRDTGKWDPNNTLGTRRVLTMQIHTRPMAKNDADNIYPDCWKFRRQICDSQNMHNI